jgi:hypothetical protein
VATESKHPWGSPLVPYVDMLERLLAHEIGCEQFDDELRAQYYGEPFSWPPPVFDILDRLLATSDSCYPDAPESVSWAISLEDLLTEAARALEELREYKYLL